jgi:2,4-dienoyl-CoA reductase-like NADH-dependent reductase (Old Yellow Enzyme family)
VAAASSYPDIFSPLEPRGVQLRNRIVSTPHATGWSHDGLIDQAEVDYHVRKSAGEPVWTGHPFLDPVESLPCSYTPNPNASRS